MKHLLTLLLIASMGITALDTSARAESPKSMSLELQFGPYLPEIDNAFQNSTLQPYADIFGSEMMCAIGPYLEYQVYQGVGTFAVGAGFRYGSISGTARRDDGTTTSETTSLHMVPITLGLTYRFDYLATRYKFPIVPYVKAGLTAAIWWVTNAKGEVANTYAPDGNEALGWSHTFGFFAGGGLQLLLDGIAPRMAASMDSETGVNNSYLFVEYLRHELDDFSSDKSINLSSHGFSFGMMFEF